MVRARLISEKISLVEKQKVEVGNVVVYQLSGYERTRSHPASSTSDAYTPRWSLPCKVTAVGKGTVECEPCGCPGANRQVPVTQLRILKGEIPSSLVDLNMSVIERENPRFPRSSVARVKSTKSQGGITWSNLLAKAQGTPEKRLKRETEVVVDVLVEAPTV